VSVVAILLVALTVGTVAGAVGIGGGSFLVPLFVMIHGLPVATAVGTSLAVIVPASLTAAVQYGLRGSLDPLLVAALVPAAVAGSVGGACLTGRLPGKVLMVSLGWVILWTASRLISDGAARSEAGGRLRTIPPVTVRRLPTADGGFVELPVSLPVLAATGFLAGGIGSALGIGGGFLTAPVLLGVFRVPARVAVGVSMAVVAAVSAAGAVVHGSLGHLSRTHALIVAAGVLPGSLLGPALAHRMPERALRRMVAVVLALLGLLMLARGGNGPP
jgi:uncharacterized membrane protein YfcA